MLTHSHRFLGRVPILATLLTMTFGVAACGDSNEQSKAGATQPSDAEPATDSERQIRATIRTVQTAYLKQQGNVLCDQLTDDGRRQLGRYAGGTGSRACERAVHDMIRRARQSNLESAPPPRVLRVKIDGDTATAAIKLAGRKPAPVRLARERGRWKQTSFFLDYGYGY